MNHLTSNHIDYITKDLYYRGIIVEDIQNEILDHVCSAVENDMANGIRFMEAYQKALHGFGHNSGLLETQKLIINHKTKGHMLKNYITIATRNLRKQSFYSLINIAGLAVGVAACLVMVLFIVNELDYDRYNLNAQRIYRVNNEIKFGEGHYLLASSTAPVAQAMMQDYPEIESTVRFRTYGSYLVRSGEGTESIKESNVAWTDSTFFKIFTVKVLQGNPKTALTNPASVAISKRMADKYFPNGNALGNTLILDNKYNAKVTAVFQDIPQASHFHFDILISVLGDWPAAKEAQSTVFLSNNFNTYLLLREGADAKALEKKLPGFIEKYVGPTLSRIIGGDFTMDKFSAAGNKYELTLMPLLNIHLHSDLKGEFEPNGSIKYVYLLGTVALFILAIACINFMNMSTARSGDRAKEVGVRKVMGSLRSHLVRQFLTESILVTLFSFLGAAGIAYLMLPLFNDLALRQLQIPFSNPSFYLCFLGGALVVGLLSGIYPSFFLSAFKPIEILKGRAARAARSGIVRSALVVFQFAISIFLIIGAITVNRQLDYIQTKKLGFSRDQVLLVKDAYALRPNVKAFKDEVSKISSVESCSVTGFLPVEVSDVSRGDDVFWKTGNEPTQENMINMAEWQVDFDYIKTLGMTMKSGRDFSNEFISDSSGVILNEEAASQFGFGDDAVGNRISCFQGSGASGSPDPNKIRSWTVIGVVKNFHFSTMREGIAPLGLFLNRSDGFVILKIKAQETRAILASVESVWKKLAPGQPFQFSFLDDEFGRMYSAEERLSGIFSVFAGLAIFIACLGLFALTAFTADQRTKEIGIRKVLGASVSSVVILLSKEFGKLILIAFVIAVPVAWYAINLWLERYVYKTEIGIMVYVLAGIGTFSIALITMGYQSIHAAMSDPVKSLKSE